MWSWLIHELPSQSLDTYAWRFGLAAILLSMAGGICGWIALDIRNRASELRVDSEKKRNERLARTEQQLSEAQSALSDLQHAQAPRKLTFSQKRALIAELASIPQPRPKIGIWYRGSDPEVEDFFRELNTTLLEAGFSTEYLMLLDLPLPKGITVNLEFPDTGLRSRFEAAFRAAEIAFGTASFEPLNAPIAPVPMVCVGSKN